MHLQRRIQNPFKRLSWRLAKIVKGLKLVIAFAKNYILGVSQDSEYASVLQAQILLF